MYSTQCFWGSFGELVIDWINSYISQINNNRYMPMTHMLDKLVPFELKFGSVLLQPVLLYKYLARPNAG